jgi:uncharacterized protein involved in type VI secretion and phage assembly
MALTQEETQADLVFQLEGGEADQFLVLRYRGTEGVCQLYRFEIELSSTDTTEFDGVVGKRACLSVYTDWGARWFHGIISRFEITGHGVDKTYYRAELVPEVWLLTHRYQSRIFQQKSVKDIITDVLTEAGIASDRFDLSGVQGASSPRDYCVQYRETDYNFICRLMEEEGIRWYFEHTEDGHVLKMADSAEYAPIEGEAEIPYQPPAEMNVSEEHVYRFRLGQCVRPGSVVLNDFNFENPKLNLESKQDCERDTGLEFSDFPGEYTEQSVGQTLASMRAEEFESGRVLGVGQSNSPRLSPGKTFDLTEHPAELLNGSYLVVSAVHEGRQSTEGTTGGLNGRGRLLDPRVYETVVRAQQHENEGIRQLAEALLQIVSRLHVGDPSAHRALTQWLYHAGQVCRDLPSTAVACGGNPLEALVLPNLIDDVSRSMSVDLQTPVHECRFECIPADVVYRPPRVTPWPVVRGTQTARVVGPSGEEIYTDEYGRVKVQFPWDRRGAMDETSSCWIRVSQGMAGGQYGMMFLPRVGQEVVVDFLEGDPDKPIIVGRVFNADHMPPYALPDEKTKSVIKTHSSKGGGGTNEIRFEDLKDSEQILIHAQADLHVCVGNEERHNVKKKQYLIVEGEQRQKITGHRSVKLEAKDALDVAGSQSVVVGGDVFHDFGGNHDHKVASEYHIKAATIVVEADSGISLKCGSNFVLIDSAGVTIVGTQIKLNSGGAALTSSISGGPASPAEPEDADAATPGKDVSYTGEESPTPPIEVEPAEGQWISFNLEDQDGNAVAGEYFEIKTPSGDVIPGTTDVNGYARVWVDEEGDCEISFPQLDSEEWDET